MSQHRIFCSTPLVTDTTVTLIDAQAHYLGHVLRIRVNDIVTLFDGGGSEFTATVDNVTRKQVELSVIEEHRAVRESALNVTLIQSVIRGERMDYCIQKASELGVHRVIPVFTHRMAVKLPKERIPKRVEHWQKIAISACEQSGRTSIPSILPPAKLQPAVELMRSKNIPILVLNPWAGAPSFSNLDPPSSDQIAVCIGPEGGFTSEELAFLSDHGAVSVKFGPRVLRSETAGVIAVAACQFTWGDC